MVIQELQLQWNQGKKNVLGKQFCGSSKVLYPQSAVQINVHTHFQLIQFILQHVSISLQTIKTNNDLHSLSNM